MHSRKNTSARITRHGLPFLTSGLHDIAHHKVGRTTNKIQGHFSLMFPLPFSVQKIICGSISLIRGGGAVWLCVCFSFIFLFYFFEKRFCYKKSETLV